MGLWAGSQHGCTEAGSGIQQRNAPPEVSGWEGGREQLWPAGKAKVMNRNKVVS